MQLIYAMGEPGQMTFAVAPSPAKLPVGAFVYAICDETSAVERIDEETCERMTEREYLTFKQMVTDAWRQELKRAHKTRPAGIVRNFLRRLSGESRFAAAT